MRLQKQRSKMGELIAKRKHIREEKINRFRNLSDYEKDFFAKAYNIPQHKLLEYILSL